MHNKIKIKISRSFNCGYAAKCTLIHVRVVHVSGYMIRWKHASGFALSVRNLSFLISHHGSKNCSYAQDD